MKKMEVRRAEICDHLADFVLNEGLPQASLRPLAAAAGLSDRMLLYYFKDKDEILAVTLELIAKRLAEKLAILAARPKASADQLEADLIVLLAGAELWPFMCVWLEVCSLAARGDPMFRAIGNRIGHGFCEWIGEMLTLEGGVNRNSVATRILRSIEGAIVMRSIGFVGPSD